MKILLKFKNKISELSNDLIINEEYNLHDLISDINNFLNEKDCCIYYRKKNLKFFNPHSQIRNIFKTDEGVIKLKVFTSYLHDPLKVKNECNNIKHITIMNKSTYYDLTKCLCRHKKMKYLEINDQTVSNVFLTRYILLLTYNNMLTLSKISISSKQIAFLNDLDLEFSLFQNIKELVIYNILNEFSRINFNKITFHNLIILTLENTEIITLYSILNHSKNIKFLKLKNVITSNVSNTNDYKNCNLMNLINLRLEYKELNKFYDVMQILSNLEFSNKLFLSVIINSIDIENSFSLETFGKFLLLKNVNILNLSLNCLLNVFSNDQFNLRIIDKILNNLKIKPYSNLGERQIIDCICELDNININSIILKNLSIDIDSCESFSPFKNNFSLTVDKLNKSIFLFKKTNKYSKSISSINSINENLMIKNIKCQNFIYQRRMSKIIFKGSRYYDTTFFQFFENFFSNNVNTCKSLELINLFILPKDIFTQILKLISKFFFKIENLKISNVNFDENNLIYFLEIIKKNTNIKTLKLSSLKFGDNNQSKLKKILFDHLFTKIRFLHLKEFKVSKFNFINDSDDLNYTFPQALFMKNLKKLHINSINDFNILSFLNISHLKKFKIKNTIIKFDDLFIFLQNYRNQLEILVLDLEINLQNLFLDITFGKLKSLTVLENKYKYTDTNKVNIINILKCSKLRELNFVVKNLNQEWDQIISSKFKFLNFKISNNN